ncbi:Transcription initiation factor TFIID subunit 7 [Hondaea fermentalgiana]|uniref:Transcription initiation factor TFIID subunit 7 n=1 Tax=Hondaea fermentalgiana TaxID=2315210 RepID=A0A2R5GUI0_9STRA|nr:Transcription initiation factor TFIID subunit 7 [Hondaea fermentalgiana]|eukprot:GBG32031.1 Transcription initiation factor TFIID subunit 7 [Hondaea fermentalgiana]
MSRVQDLTVGGLEEHVLLRVPPELSDRVQDVVSRPDGAGEKILIEAESSEKPRELVFKIGDDAYYATLRDLPTVVETEKTKDSYVYYKSADVAQVVEVQNIKVGSKPRPEVPHLMDDGLTPPMKQARSQRFSRMDRTVRNGLPEEKDERTRLVGRMDQQLRKIVASLPAKTQAGANVNLATQDKLSEDKTTVLQYDELVDMEPFMQYWDDRTIIKQGTDNFLTDSRRAYDLAFENYLQHLNKIGISPEAASRAVAAEQASASGSATTSTAGAGSNGTGPGASGSSSSNAAASRSERPAIKMVGMDDFFAKSGPGAPQNGRFGTRVFFRAATATTAATVGCSFDSPQTRQHAVKQRLCTNAARTAPASSTTCSTSCPGGASSEECRVYWCRGDPGICSAIAITAVGIPVFVLNIDVNVDKHWRSGSKSQCTNSQCTHTPMPSASPGLTPGMTPGGTPGGTPGVPMPSPPPGGADEDPAMLEIRKLEYEARKAKAALDAAIVKLRKSKNVLLKKRYREQQEKAQAAFERAKAKLQAARDALAK